MTDISTPADVIDAAMAIATDAAEGRLDPAKLERQAAAELSKLMLIEPEPGSDLEALQAESARRVLARGGIPADEVAEWLAVQRRRENPEAVEAATALESAESADIPADADSAATGPRSGEIGTALDHNDEAAFTELIRGVPDEVLAVAAAAEDDAAALAVIAAYRAGGVQ